MEPARAHTEGDYTVFFGPNAEKFLGHWRKLVAKNKQQAAGWCWPAFFVSYVWYFYRKMYGFGFVLFLVPIAVVLLLPKFSPSLLVIHLFFAVYAKSWYIGHAGLKILKAKTQGQNDEERADLIGKAGGVSLPLGILSGVVLVGQTLLFLLSLLTL
jgi:hypothetical protein